MANYPYIIPVRLNIFYCKKTKRLETSYKEQYIVLSLSLLPLPIWSTNKTPKNVTKNLIKQLEIQTKIGFKDYCTITVCSYAVKYLQSS